MPQKVSFGFTIPQRGVFFGIATWPEMLAMAREADRIALFDSVWVGDSVMAKPRPESIALLGALAGATSRVKLGVGCMASFPIRAPIIFAYQWATLDLISKWPDAVGRMHRNRRGRRERKRRWRLEYYRWATRKSDG